MSKFIPRQFIDDLLSKIDIIDIIGSRVKLKRQGTNHIGLCPFHNEKTPSFSVSQTKQFYHCFGCHATGSAISFLMQFERLEFVEAVESLAAQAGLTIPQEAGMQNRNNYQELYQAAEKASLFFEQQLPKSPPAINYLKSRGLTGIIAKKFRIGYAPNSWDTLSSIYKNDLNLKKQLIQAGVLAEKNQQVYSRLRDRVTFPIRNTKGKIIGFGGRTISNDPAKYLNSPETAIFHKGNELYGLYEAKKADKLASIIVVEGYLDVISLAQFGINNAVATLGTAISQAQIQLLLRNSSVIIFCFDGDQAGKTAAWRALENSLPFLRDGIEIKFLFLQDGLDPDDLIRNTSSEHFNQLLKNNTVNLADFFIKQLIHNINTTSIEGKSKFAKVGAELLSKMPLGIFRQLLSAKIAEQAGINPEEIHNQLATTAIDNNKINMLTLQTPIQNFIGMLLHHPNLISEITDIDHLTELKIDGVELITELIHTIKNTPNITTGAILEYWRDKDTNEILNQIAQRPPIIPKENLKNELTGIIHSVRKLDQELEIGYLLTKASQSVLNDEERKKLSELITILKR